MSAANLAKTWGDAPAEVTDADGCPLREDGDDGSAQHSAPATPPAPAPLPPIYYDAGRKEFLRQADDGTWLRLNDSGIRRELKLAGISPTPPKGEICSELDRVISRLTLSQNVVYAAPLAGHQAGLVEIAGQKILVTESPRTIEPKAGPWPLINTVLSGLFPPEEGIGDIQRTTFLCWLKVAVRSLRAGKRQHGQAMAIAGPVESGKSLLLQIVTWALGGREAKPYPFMSGETKFNGELFAAEHLVIDDEAASRDGRVRAKFGAALKQFCVVTGMRCEAKHQNAIRLEPFWRVSIAVNDEPQALAVLPTITADLEDKLILLKAQRVSMPMPTETADEKAAFQDALLSEMPAFLEHLLATPIPPELSSPRFGVRHFHHEDLRDALGELSKGHRLLSLIDECLFGPMPEPWEGKAYDLERALLSTSGADEARRLFTWDHAAGNYLGELRKTNPARFSFIHTKNGNVWTIKPPMR